MKDLKKSVDFLFISKVRIKIIRLFFLNMKTSYHIRGVVREISEEINAVRRELLRLDQIKLLIAEKRGNRTYFTLNKDFPFFNELLSIIYKTYGLGGEIIRCRKEINEIQFAMLTNSYITGEKKEENDLDLIIIGDKINVPALTAAVQRAERQISKEINYSIFKVNEFNLRLKRRDTFILKNFQGYRVVLIGNEDDLSAKL